MRLDNSDLMDLPMIVITDGTGNINLFDLLAVARRYRATKEEDETEYFLVKFSNSPERWIERNHLCREISVRNRQKTAPPNRDNET